jgi:uncharacterized lipoprotein
MAPNQERSGREGGYTMKTTLKFVLPLLAATFLAGCGQDAADTAAEKLTGVDIDRDGDKATYTMEGPDGTKVQVGDNLTVPDGFPDDVSVYPDMKLISSSTIPNGFMVMGQTGDSVDKVAGFYTDKMTSGGWEKESEMTQPDMRLLTYKKEGRNASVTVVKADDGTTVQLSTTKAGS